MKGYRFYEEFKSNADKRKHRGCGQVLALIVDERARPYVHVDGCLEAISSVYDQPNGPTCSGSVSRDHLAKKCRRVPEAYARTVHPALFTWLDSFEDESADADAAEEGRVEARAS